MEGFGKIFTLLALVAAASAAATSFASISTAGGAAGLFQVGQKGVVTNTTRCGGYGTPIQLRVSDCEGRCSLIPGKVYDIEWDFFPKLRRILSVHRVRPRFCRDTPPSL